MNKYFVCAKQMFEYRNNSVVGDTDLYFCKPVTHIYILIIHANMMWLYTIKQTQWATHMFLFIDLSKKYMFCRVLHNLYIHTFIYIQNTYMFSCWLDLFRLYIYTPLLESRSKNNVFSTYFQGDRLLKRPTFKKKQASLKVGRKRCVGSTSFESF